jgi:hypothetical protein
MSWVSATLDLNHEFAAPEPDRHRLDGKFTSMTHAIAIIRKRFGEPGVAALLLSVAIALTTTACGRSDTTTPPDSASGVAGEISGNSHPEAAPGGVDVRTLPDNPVGSNPDMAASIRHAFDTDLLREVQLLDMQCSVQRCSVSFEADPELPVRKMLAQQLAQSSHSVATVHSGGPNLLYVAIPAKEPDEP